MQNKNERLLPASPIDRNEGRRRTQKYFHDQIKPGKPLVTVITVVLNGKDLIESTIQSVLNQTYENIEYIVIDGASTDGTIDIIKKYDDRLSYWLSEPDNGIYDAMNKGFRAASGEWINFMNAGDSFYEPDIIASIFNKTHDNIDLIYGHHQFSHRDDFSVVNKALEVKHLWKGMICRHQSMFTKASLLKKHPFDHSYKIGADFEFIFSAFISDCKFQHIDRVIATVSVGGISDRNLIVAIKEMRQIVKKQHDHVVVDIYYGWRIFFTYVKILIKRILPRKISEMVIALKNR